MATTNYWSESSADYQASPWTALKTGQPTTPAAQNWASAQPAQRTAAVSTPSAPDNHWTSVGGVNMPNFSKDDWEWKDYSYTPGGYSADAFGATGDSGPAWQDEKFDAGGWMLTNAARERLRAGGWDLSNRNNMAFNIQAGRNGLKGDASPEFTGGAVYDYGYSAGGDNGPGTQTFNKERTDADYAALKAANPLDFIRDAMYKTGEKEGQAIKYRRDGDRLVAVNAGTGEWDTNIANRKRNVALGKAALSVASMGAAAPAMAAAQAGTGILGSGLTLGQIGTGLGAINTFSGGKVPGLSEIGMVTGLAGNIGSLANGVSNGINSVGDALKLGQAGYGALQKGSQIMNMFSGPDEQYTNKMGQTMTRPARDPNIQYAGGTPNFNEGGGGNQGGGMGWLDSLVRMGAGAYSEHQNRDAFTGINDYFSRMEEQRAPIQQRLQESYDNPNAYLQSPEYQALAGIRGNQLNRQASAGGRLANNTDREVLMQQHAQAGLKDYRQGLTSALSQHQLPLQALLEATRRTGNAGGAAAGGMGYGGMNGPGGSGGVSGAVNGISNIVNGVGGAFRTIQDLLGGGGNYGNTFPGADVSGSMDSWDESLMGGGSGGGFTPNYGNTFETELPSGWNWDDMDSWDINSFFDSQAGGNFWGIE